MSTTMVLRTELRRSRNARERQGTGRNGKRCRWSFDKPVIVGWRCRFRKAAPAQSKREQFKTKSLP